MGQWVNILGHLHPQHQLITRVIHIHKSKLTDLVPQFVTYNTVLSLTLTSIWLTTILLSNIRSIWKEFTTESNSIESQPNIIAHYHWETSTHSTSWYKISSWKLRVLYLELSDHSEIGQAYLQHRCPGSCQIAKQFKSSISLHELLGKQILWNTEQAPQHI